MTVVAGPSNDDHGSSVALGDLDDVVRRARRGNPAAFATLVTRLQPRVFRWALALTSDADEAEDVVQDTFIAMHAAIASFRGDAPFTTWTYRITARAASRRHRVTHRQSILARGAPHERAVYETDPGARVDRARVTEAVRLLWSALPARQRVVFDLVDLQGYTPAEASVMLTLKPVTLRANLFKARRAIRAGLLARYTRGQLEDGQ